MNCNALSAAKLAAEDYCGYVNVAALLIRPPSDAAGSRDQAQHVHARTDGQSEQPSLQTQKR
jgi:hypothetical protein